MIKSSKVALVIISAASMLSTSPVHSREFVDIYRECGLGGMIFKEDTENNRLFAIISNVTWDWGTSAILSNASSEQNCVGGSVAAAAFAMQSYPSIERDLSKGEGEHMQAMLTLMGCSDNVQASLTNDLRIDMVEAMSVNGFDANDQVGKAGILFNMVDARIEQSYSTSCTAV